MYQSAILGKANIAERSQQLLNFQHQDMTWIGSYLIQSSAQRHRIDVKTFRYTFVPRMARTRHSPIRGTELGPPYCMATLGQDDLEPRGP